MSKHVTNWLNLATSIAVIMGILFLGVEIRQNTEMMKSQTRDSISEKQMMFSEWVATEADLSNTLAKVNANLPLEPGERMMHAYFLAGVWREWENSYYQYQQGLFDRDEFEPRLTRWRATMRNEMVRSIWVATRQNYSPSFRVVVDSIIEDYSQTLPTDEPDEELPVP